MDLHKILSRVASLGTFRRVGFLFGVAFLRRWAGAPPALGLGAGLTLPPQTAGGRGKLANAAAGMRPRVWELRGEMSVRDEGGWFICEIYQLFVDFCCIFWVVYGIEAAE